MSQIECKMCQRNCKGNLGLSSHIVKFHKLPSKKYYDNFIKLEHEGKCIICSKETHYKGIGTGYTIYCSVICQANSLIVKENREITMLKRYGVTTALRFEKFRQKQKNTCLDRYGDENYVNIEKMKQTKLDRYGDAGFRNILKAKETCLKRYGVEFPFQSEKVRKRGMETFLGMKYEKYLKLLPKKKKYYRKVKQITNKQPIHLLENFDKLRGLNGVKGAYQLDHIIPKNYGFKNNIDPKIIGNIDNLQFIPWKENISKSNKLPGEIK